MTDELDILPAATETTLAREREAHKAVALKRDEIARVDGQHDTLAADLDEARRKRASGIEEFALSLTGEPGSGSRLMHVAKTALGMIGKPPTDAQSFEIATRGLELLDARRCRLRFELTDLERERDGAVAEVLRERADRGVKLFAESIEWAGGLAREILNTRAALQGYVAARVAQPHIGAFLNGCDVKALTELLLEADWMTRQPQSQSAATARFAELSQTEPAAHVAATR